MGFYPGASTHTGATLYPGIGAPLLRGAATAMSLIVDVAWGADLTADSATWTWTDITADVRADPGLSWKLGRQDESSRSNPAALTLRLDNRSGNYSLGGRSANWPNVRRGTPVRVRVNPGDGGGYRTAYLGFADGWTPTWDTTAGTVAVVELSASGTLRRLGQGAAPVQSPLRRYLASNATVMAYWPMEDGKRAEVLAPAVGTAQMTYGGTVALADDKDSFVCSAPLPTTTAGSFDVLVDTYASTGENQVRWLMAVPTAGLTDGVVLAVVHTSGTIARWEWSYGTGGTYTLKGYNSDGTLNFNSGAGGFNADGTTVRASLELVQNGADVDWQFGVTAVTATSAGYISGTVAGKTVGVVTRAQFAPNRDVDGVTFGHLSVQNAQTSLYEAAGPLTAYNGEAVASSRLSRLCTENGVTLTLYSGTADAATRGDLMGPQESATLLSLLRDCEDAEQGQLWDGLTAGLAYTTRRRHENATATLTVDAAAGELAPPFEAIDDDQRTRNRATVSRQDGADATFEDTTGDLGTDTIGVYADSLTVNAYSDGSVLDLASWLVHRGTVPGYRYPSVTVDLCATPSLAGAALDLFPGARIDVTGLDGALTGMPAETVSLTVEGVRHELHAAGWRVTATCSPNVVWKVATIAAATGDTAEPVFRVDSDTVSTVGASAAAGATSLSVATSSGPLWTTTADDYPLALDVGGVQVTASACSGATSPQTFTVSALPVAVAAGARVRLYEPPSLGL